MVADRVCSWCLRDRLEKVKAIPNVIIYEWRSNVLVQVGEWISGVRPRGIAGLSVGKLR